MLTIVLLTDGADTCMHALCMDGYTQDGAAMKSSNTSGRGIS
jgi:hypothetical protein